MRIENGMRKFRFIGDPKNYNNRKGLEFGKFYFEMYKPFPTSSTTLRAIFRGNRYLVERTDWEELSNEDQAPDSAKNYKSPPPEGIDLQNLSITILSSLVSRNYDLIHGRKVSPKELSNISITCAKELIRQLNKELNK